MPTPPTSSLTFPGIRLFSWFANGHRVSFRGNIGPFLPLLKIWPLFPMGDIGRAIFSVSRFQESLPNSFFFRPLRTCLKLTLFSFSSSQFRPTEFPPRWLWISAVPPVPRIIQSYVLAMWVLRAMMAHYSSHFFFFAPFPVGLFQTSSLLHIQKSYFV